MPKDKQISIDRPASLTVDILENLFDMMGKLTMHNINRYQAYEAIHKVRPSYSKSQACKAFDNLRRRGYLIDRVDEQGAVSVQFTAKAKMKIVDKLTSEMEIADHYHFLSFDVPEELHLQRDRFRRTIKRMGFSQIQQSLWVTNKDVGELVQALAYEHGIERFIVYIVAVMSDIDGLLAKRFQ